MTDSTEQLTVDQWQDIANTWRALYKATMRALEEAVAKHNDIHDKYRAAVTIAASYRQQLNALTTDSDA